jgi:hypothetical protein
LTPLADAIGLICTTVAALREWLDEGRWFRVEEDYVTLLTMNLRTSKNENSQRHFTKYGFFSVAKSETMRPAEFKLTPARFASSKKPLI